MNFLTKEHIYNIYISKFLSDRHRYQYVAIAGSPAVQTGIHLEICSKI